MLYDNSWELYHEFYNATNDVKTKNSELQINNFFNFIEQNFDKLKTNTDYSLLINIFKKIICVPDLEENKRIDVSVHILEIFNKHKNNENDISFILLLLYHIIDLIEAPQLLYLTFSENLFEELMEFLMKNQYPRLITHVTICLQIYASKLNAETFLHDLWQIILQNSANVEELPEYLLQLLLQLHDEFCWAVQNFIAGKDIMLIIKKLVSSNLNGERKSGSYLLKKQYSAFMTKDDKKELRDFMKIYITMIDNIDENQSHLILPSLEILNDMNFSQFEDWMEILFKLLLENNNSLVIRWTLEHILSKRTLADLNAIMLTQFLQASNNSSLYNKEDYFLPTDNITDFLQYEQNKFFTCFALINWKPVPLHFWLNEISSIWHKIVNISNVTFLRIAAIIHDQCNLKLRTKLRQLFENIFELIISKLNINEYITYIETIYNTSDKFTHMNQFIDKLENCTKIYKDAKITQRTYEILTNYLSNKLIDSLETTLLNYLNKLKSDEHSWFRFIVLFNFNSNETKKFCRNAYGVDLEALSKSTLQKITKQIIEKFVFSNDELPFVRMKCIDFYVSRQKTLKLNDFLTSSANCPYRIETLLDKGSQITMVCLSILLTDYEEETPTSVLNAFMKTISDFEKHHLFVLSTVQNLLTYLTRQTQNIAKNYAENILEKHLENYNITCAVLESGIELSKETYINGLMLSNPKTGDARIEDSYMFYTDINNNSNYYIRQLYIKNLPKNLRNSEFIIELLNENAKISKNQPRHFLNSNEHRLKIRIAIAILHLTLYDENIGTFWVDDLWDVLLTQNNQLNVILMYELLIGICAPSIDVILEKIKTIHKYTCSQQVSIVCVANIYIMYNFSTLSIFLLNSFIELLLPLTMGANYQLRTYTQLLIHRILNECGRRNISIPSIGRLCSVIVNALSEPLNKLMNDIRIKSIDYYLLNSNSGLPIYKYILSATNTPYDECEQIEEDISTLNDSRRHFICKTLKKTINACDEKLQLDSTQLILQRKMNPYNISMQNKTLKQINSQMFVVTTLVEKPANLGGIARTCEVLGIKNLVISSKKLIEKCDFQNLSMTAEKSLNIIEVNLADLLKYLLKKRTEDFTLVGAEQTDKSGSLIGFQFPQKCVLLLGHEKHGIPANILKFLDYAIEIPQFGLVRSLNVHVTGALFMWEYCKQQVE